MWSMRIYVALCIRGVICSIMEIPQNGKAAIDTILSPDPTQHHVWALFLEGAVVQIASGDFVEQLASQFLVNINYGISGALALVLSTLQTIPSTLPSWIHPSCQQAQKMLVLMSNSWVLCPSSKNFQTTPNWIGLQVHRCHGVRRASRNWQFIARLSDSWGGFLFCDPLHCNLISHFQASEDRNVLLLNPTVIKHCTGFKYCIGFYLLGTQS